MPFLPGGLGTLKLSPKYFFSEFVVSGNLSQQQEMWPIDCLTVNALVGMCQTSKSEDSLKTWCLLLFSTTQCLVNTAGTEDTWL